MGKETRLPHATHARLPQIGIPGLGLNLSPAYFIPVVRAGRPPESTCTDDDQVQQHRTVREGSPETGRNGRVVSTRHPSRGTATGRKRPMTMLIHLIQSTAEGASAAGVLYAGTISIIAMTAIAAPTPERRRDARAVLKLVLRSRRLD
jgi:hypothetical protein